MTKEEALTALEALGLEERGVITRFANREIHYLQMEYDVNVSNEDAIFQDSIDANQQERRTLITMYRAVLTLIRKTKDSP